jgi:hypothetical protein
MSLRVVIWGLVISSGLCWLAWLLTLFNTNPTQGGQPAILAFYLSLFAGLFGTLTLAGYALRRLFGRNEVKYGIIRTAFRQAFLASLLLVGLLVLESLHIFSWWDAWLLIIVVVLLELYLRAYGNQRTI